MTEQTPGSESPPSAAPPPLPGEPPPGRLGQRVSTGLAWLVIVAVVYVLSPLPMGVALDLLPYGASRALYPKLERLYTPLTWLYERNDRVREFYNWYESLLDS